MFIANKSAYLHVPPRPEGAPIFVHSWSEYVYNVQVDVKPGNDL